MGLVNPDQEPTRTAIWSPPIIRVAGGILLLLVLALGLAAWVLPLDNIFLLLFFIFLIAGCIYYVIRQFTQLQREILSMHDQISRSERELLSTTRRSQAIFQLSQK